jgi:hypothetical protein
MLESLAQVTSVPAATCTFIGPEEPEYAVSPTVMRSTPPSVSNSVVVIVIDISARTVHASFTP